MVAVGAMKPNIDHDLLDVPERLPVVKRKAFDVWLYFRNVLHFFEEGFVFILRVFRIPLSGSK